MCQHGAGAMPASPHGSHYPAAGGPLCCSMLQSPPPSAAAPTPPHVTTAAAGSQANAAWARAGWLHRAGKIAPTAPQKSRATMQGQPQQDSQVKKRQETIRHQTYCKPAQGNHMQAPPPTNSSPTPISSKWCCHSTDLAPGKHSQPTLTGCSACRPSAYVF